MSKTQKVILIILAMIAFIVFMVCACVSVFMSIQWLAGEKVVQSSSDTGMSPSQPSGGFLSEGLLQQPSQSKTFLNFYREVLPQAQAWRSDASIVRCFNWYNDDGYGWDMYNNWGLEWEGWVNDESSVENTYSIRFYSSSAKAWWEARYSSSQPDSIDIEKDIPTDEMCELRDMGQIQIDSDKLMGIIEKNLEQNDSFHFVLQDGLSGPVWLEDWSGEYHFISAVNGTSKNYGRERLPAIRDTLLYIRSKYSDAYLQVASANLGKDGDSSNWQYTYYSPSANVQIRLEADQDVAGYIEVNKNYYYDSSEEIDGPVVLDQVQVDIEKILTKSQEVFGSGRDFSIQLEFDKQVNLPVWVVNYSGETLYINAIDASIVQPS